MTRAKYVISAAVISAVLLLYFTGFTGPQDLFGLRVKHHTFDGVFPSKIWQKWETPAQELEGELQRFSTSWLDMNPSYRYELLTSESASTFVEDRFRKQPEVVETYQKVGDKILQADLLRYLLLLAEGGVYTDIDTHCSRPIEQWISPEHALAATLVVGIEYDSRGGETRGDFAVPVQLCQWTFMAKPGSCALQHVVDRVVSNLKVAEAEGKDLKLMNQREIQATTGPQVFTDAILESLSNSWRAVSYNEISNLTEPRLIDDVLFLPISAFGSGQDHSGSKPWGNEEQLMSHHWFGFKGWKTTHE